MRRSGGIAGGQSPAADASHSSPSSIDLTPTRASACAATHVVERRGVGSLQDTSRAEGCRRKQQDNRTLTTQSGGNDGRKIRCIAPKGTRAVAPIIRLT